MRCNKYPAKDKEGENMNLINLKGKVVRVFTGKRYTILTIFVDGYRKNFPTVMYKNSDVTFPVKVGDFVTVEGNIKVRILDTEGTTHVHQFIKGTKLELAVDALTEKFGVPLEGRYEYLNEVFISGVVQRIIPQNNVVRLLVRPDGCKFNVLVNTYERYPVAFAERYKEGTRVCVKGEIQTTVKDGPDGNRHFENLVCRDIAIDEKNE